MCASNMTNSTNSTGGGGSEPDLDGASIGGIAAAGVVFILGCYCYLKNKEKAAAAAQQRLEDEKRKNDVDYVDLVVVEAEEMKESDEEVLDLSHLPVVKSY